MLEQRETTNVHLLVTAAKGLKEEIHINRFLDIRFIALL